MSLMCVALFSLTSQLHGATVFSTGFQYAGGAPTVGSDAANLNGADGQVGSFSGSIPTGLMTFESGALVADGNPINAQNNWSFKANLTSTVALAGGTVSFDYGTKRSQNDGSHSKDNFIARYDSLGAELFRIQVSAENTTSTAGAGQRYRLGVLVGANPVLWNLPGANDVDNSVPQDLTSRVNISLAFSATGYAITLDRFNNITNGDYTTGEIAFSGGSNLAYLQFEGMGGADSTKQSGYYLDKILVNGTAIPEPSAFTLLGLGLGALMLRRRRA